ncbi:ATP-binding cassette domain-containing protein [Kovacikia minuta]
MKDASPLLEINRLSVNYGGIQALQAIDLHIYAGEVITLIGANGAGKTTTLRAISRILNVREGRIIYEGRDITRRRAHEVVQLGIAHSPEGRRVLARQTVMDNLELGAYSRSDRLGIKTEYRTTVSYLSPVGRTKTPTGRHPQWW